MGLEDQLLPGSCGETTAWPAAMVRLSGPARCSRCTFPEILLSSVCLALRSWWTSCVTADSWGGAGREEMERAQRGKKQTLQRQNARCQSPWRLLSIPAIDRKERELEELRIVTYFSFGPSGASCSLGTAACTHPHIHSHIFCCFEIKFTLSLHRAFHCQVDAPIFLVSLIKHGDVLR